MQKFIASVAMLMATLIVVGCSNKSEPTQYLLPVLNEAGQTELREVTIETLSDPYTVSGPAARVLYNPEVTNYGLNGEAAKSRLAQNGDVFIPLDVATSQSLSIYSTFEQIKKFEDRVLPESQLKWPRTIALGLLFSGGRAVNNAFYSGALDAIGILPYASGHLPLTYNSGVLAHEHFHAHFYHLILTQYKSELPPMAHADHLGVLAARCGFESYYSYSEAQKKLIVNDMILRGWNEGLADLYAYLVSGNANFFEASLMGEDRVVTKSPGVMYSRADFERYLHEDLISNGTDHCEVGARAYALGTQIARTMVERIQHGEFDSFESDKNWTRNERALRFVFSKLRAFSSQIGVVSKNPALEPKFILDLMTLPTSPENKTL